MTVNRSLDDFADAESEEDSEASRAAAPTEPADGSTAVDPEPEDGGVTVDDGSLASDDGDVAVDSGNGAPDAGDGAPDEGDVAAGDRDVTVDDAVDDAAERDEVGQPVSTYAWVPEGGPCSTCGETVQERWRDGDAFVCVGCKGW